MSSELARQISAAALGPPAKAAAPTQAFIKTRAEVWLRRYCFTEDFLAFQGHFEGRPVLPALAQVLTAKDCAEAALGRKVFIEAVDQGKFLSLIAPGGILSVYAQAPLADEGAPSLSGAGQWRFHLCHARPGEAEKDASFLRLKIKGEVDIRDPRVAHGL